MGEYSLEMSIIGPHGERQAVAVELNAIMADEFYWLPPPTGLTKKGAGESAPAQGETKL
jgi:hypothetical protein